MAIGDYPDDGLTLLQRLSRALKVKKTDDPRRVIITSMPAMSEPSVPTTATFKEREKVKTYRPERGQPRNRITKTCSHCGKAVQ